MDLSIANFGEWSSSVLSNLERNEDSPTSLEIAGYTIVTALMLKLIYQFSIAPKTQVTLQNRVSTQDSDDQGNLYTYTRYRSHGGPEKVLLTKAEFEKQLENDREDANDSFRYDPPDFE